MRKLGSYLWQAKRGSCAVFFCGTVILALALLVVSAFFPQTLITRHVLDSWEAVSLDNRHPTVADYSPASRLDTGTDAMMLRASMSTRDDYLGSVLTNPIYTYGENGNDWDSIPDTVAQQAMGMPHSGVFYYSRYWMGFRVLLRFALTFLTYGQIKRYLAFAFLTLFVYTMIQIGKHGGSRLGFLFALSVILVRPHVMATSMQYTCCFFIAFFAMLMIPWLRRNAQFETIFFMEVGMITMYLDFYTVPLITFGFPMVYLCVLQGKNGEKLSVLRVLKSLFAWVAGYALMWIAKLTLTTVLTSVNSLYEGFSSFTARVGLEKRADLEEYYSLQKLWDALKDAIFADDIGRLVYVMGFMAILVFVLIRVRKNRVPGKCLRNGLPALFVAVMPVIWFLLTVQPTAIHAYFQYRTIALTYWAVGGYVDLILPATAKWEQTKVQQLR